MSKAATQVAQGAMACANKRHALSKDVREVVGVAEALEHNDKLKKIYFDNINVVDGSFDPHASDLSTAWATGASIVCCVSPYPNGIALSLHGKAIGGRDCAREIVKGKKSMDFGPNHFLLRYKDTRDFQLPQGKYYIYKDDYVQALENTLIRLRRDGLLHKTVVYFGMTADPFYGLSKKFKVTMNCLNLLQQYLPDLIVVQTRSPLVISALAILKMMGKKVVVAIPIETKLEQAIQLYTPGQARIRDRLLGADGLRAQGILVNLIASPILPYGEYYRDAWDFAELLEQHADYITVGCLSTGVVGEENQLRALPLARRLVADDKCLWLRPHAHKQLYYALKVIAPHKLRIPERTYGTYAQLSLFAA